MPTEHEYKYLLDLNAFQVIEDLLDDRYNPIQQGYLFQESGMCARIRKFTYLNGKDEWYFTFKKHVGTRVIEIEQILDNRDGIDLWEKCVGKLTKRRYTLLASNSKWEIDFFFDSSDTIYFALAEIELEEGSPRPQLPQILENHVIHQVDLMDDRFSNTKLSDIEYAKKLYQSIKE